MESSLGVSISDQILLSIIITDLRGLQEAEDGQEDARARVAGDEGGIRAVLVTLGLVVGAGISKF